MRSFRWLTLFAAVFMLLPLPIMQYVGEEGLMAIKSYEMYVRGDWLHPSIFGSIWPHSPLWHWPVIGISTLIGWNHVDVAIRLVSVVASWMSAWMAGWFATWLFRGKEGVAWLAALIYLALGEVTFWYGWLGYVDALFGCFVFSSIVLLWRAVAEENLKWMFFSCATLALAFLTKNITAYVLYGVAGTILLWRYGRWGVILKSPMMLLPFALACLVPICWQIFVVPAGENTAETTIRDALRNFVGFNFSDYARHWLSYPMVFAFRALPLTLLFAWWWLRKEYRFALDSAGATAAWVLLGCFLPFWVSAGATPRYLVPLYGIVALLLTSMVLSLERERQRIVWKALLIVILFKVPYSLVILPYIKDGLPERDVKVVAQEVMALTQDAPLRTQNDVATGLAIAAYIDVWQQDREPVWWYRDGEKGVYVLAEAETPVFGHPLKTWRLRGDIVYLYYVPR